MKLITRAEWGARKPDCMTELPLNRVLGFAVHYSGTGAEFDMDAKAVMRSHQRFHMDTRDWCDIAYTFEISMRTGELLEGRGYGKRTAANGTNAGNDQFYAVCFQGGDKVRRDDVSKAAVETFSELCREFKAKKGVWPVIKPHSHFLPTECPGDELRHMIALEPWKVAKIPMPSPLPKWWWRWNAWRLGEGDFKPFGPKNKAQRWRTDAPALIPPWAWLRAQQFDRARNK